ncbi:MAG: squalene--hopene cyclase [Verrucomicrobia bacterium]|nr:squalene--hopene cyclase [Verrucomicrobiota bacterium]
MNPAASILLAAVLAAPVFSFAETHLAKREAPGPNSASEPLAKRLSVAKAVDFIDRASLHWQRSRKCVTCHTNGAYLMARAQLKADPAPHGSVRTFYDQYVAGWAKKKPDPEGIVATASALAMDDAASGKLTQVTRAAFDEAWAAQRPDGSWDWLKCGWGPFESDDHYGVTLAAIAAAKAPGGYAQTGQAAAGLAKLRGWLENHPPRLPHHKAMMLWLGHELPNWVEKEDRLRWQNELLGLQLPDGGWATAALGDWKRKDGSAQTLDRADGYGTGFVIFALRQSGLPASHPAIRLGIGWLKSHQRESGRWFTRSPYKDGRHYISHAGTVFALLALAECGELD